jgi:hypothetical protein
MADDNDQLTSVPIVEAPDATPATSGFLDALTAAVNAPGTPAAAPAREDKPKTPTAPTREDKPKTTAAPAAKSAGPETHRAEDWKKVKDRAAADAARADAAEAKLKELEAKLAAKSAEAAKASLPERDAEMERLRQEAEQYRKQSEEHLQYLQRFALENDPAFQKEYADRLGQLGNRLAGTMPPETLATVRNALNLPPGQARVQAISEALADLPAYQQQRAGNILSQIEDLVDERQQKITQSRENWQALQKEREAAQIKRVRDSEAIMHQTLKAISDPEKGLGVFQTREGDEKWNAQVEKRRQLATELYMGKVPLDQLAYHCAMAAAAPSLAEGLQALMAENTELKEQIKRFTTATPTPGTPGGDEGVKELSFEEKLAAAIRA